MACSTSNTSFSLRQIDENRNDYIGSVTNDDEQRIKKRTPSCSNSTEQEQDEQQVQQQCIFTPMVVKGKRTIRQKLRFDRSPNHQEDENLVDEEQLEIADCLILLAQGQSGPSSLYSSPPPISCNKSDPILIKLSGNKRRSSSSSNLSLNGIYECKTCGRTFPSFQALGGHRTSHKKSKITTTTTNSDLDYLFKPVAYPDRNNSSSPLDESASLSLQLGNIYYLKTPPTPTTSAVLVQNKSSRNKIHECSICGAEFSSGQALGGHMRRHRGHVIPLNSYTATANTNIANTTLSLSTTVDINPNSSAVRSDRTNNNNAFLSLDLNLPASRSSGQETKYSLPSKQQSASAIVFSKPGLVDCFY